MGLDALLTHIEQSGIKLCAEGETLRYSGAKDVLTPKLIKQMKLSKAELLTHLHAIGPLGARQEGIPRVLRER